MHAQSHRSSHANPGLQPRRFRRFQFAPLEEIRDEMDRLWSEFAPAVPTAPWAATGWGGLATAARFPAVNMSETPDTVVIEAELPGLKAADLDISIVGEELVLKGHRPEAEGEHRTEAGEERSPEGTKPDGRSAQAGWLRRERETGSFERRIELPVAIDPAKVEARLADGVLTLRCAKVPECQPHKIEIRS